MALNDILTWRAPTGGVETLAFPVAATQTFLSGEPLLLTGGGALAIAASNPATIIGIAAHRSTDADGASFATGTMCSIYGVQDVQQFRTDNFATDGSGTAAVPTQTHIGELAGLVLTGAGNWVVDTAMANLILQIDDVLDINRNSITDPNLNPGAGVHVLFHFI
jgi:hypothetical protein